MPIKPENKKRYPDNWPQIRAEVALRSGNKCEGSPRYPYCREAQGTPHRATGSIVVLTVAHLDHMPENNDGYQLFGEILILARSNLRHWCQRCHCTYDAKHRAETRRLEKEKKFKNQKSLF